MEYIIGVVIFIFILGIIVIIHEGGHLLVAKRNGAYCHEFSIGMGPKIKQFYKDKSGTVYNLRAIPLGGYVSIAGENTGVEEDENLPKELLFDHKSKWIRFKILVAGASMNFILGIAIIILLGFFTGIPIDDPQQVEIINNSPMDKAGIKSGDYITAVNGTLVNTSDEALQIISNDKEKEVEISYKEDLEAQVKTVEVTKDKEGKIGVSDYKETQKYNLLGSIWNGFYSLGVIISSTLYSLYLLFTGGAAPSDLMGPVGMATATTGVAQLGIIALLKWTAFLSLAVGAMNLLPIPALDGGRILFIVIEAIMGKPVNPKIETLLNNLIFYGLLILIVYVTFFDILRIPQMNNIINK